MGREYKAGDRVTLESGEVVVVVDRWQKKQRVGWWVVSGDTELPCSVEEMWDRHAGDRFEYLCLCPIDEADQQEMPDVVAAPPHYTRVRPEPIDVIEGWGLGYRRGNALKYIARAGYKGDAVTDLRKAIWYLEREVKALESARGISGFSTEGDSK